MSRTLISYDDITPQEPQLGPPVPSEHPPPAKKRRTQQKAPPRRNTQHVQHWDDPGTTAEAIDYDNALGNASSTSYAKDGEEGQEEESRELTHQEIWDDSVLIDAWNSATAEYEAYHGKGKKWKEEPVKKSPLWYNIPPDPSKLKASQAKCSTMSEAESSAQLEQPAEPDSRPLNFDTFVPSHDPSLAIPGDTSAALGFNSQSFLPDLSMPMVGQDEAFSRAMSAMYWSGYWTAVYHYNRNIERRPAESQQDNGLVEDEEVAGDAEDSIVDAATEEDLISSQR